jgi:hypothetical protein
MKSTSESSPQPVVVQPRFTLTSMGCAAVIFLFGLVIGIGGLVLYAIISQSDRPLVAIPPVSSQNAVHVQLSSTFITQLVKKNISAAGLPGKVSNVQVVLTKNGPMTITGDDQVDVLGLAIVKHFTVIVQPLVLACRPHVHVLHADMDGIPVTGFATSFESQIDQQIQINTKDLPQGFTYCATGVQTEANALSVNVSATPIGQ